MKTVRIFFIFFATCLLLPAQPQSPGDPLRVYAELKNKTILRPSAIPHIPDEVLSQASADPSQAAALIESELMKNHFQVLADGERFIRIVPEGWEDSPGGKFLSRIPAVSSFQKQDSAEERLQSGTINLPRLDLNNFVKIYGELRRRNILMPLVLPGVISFRSQTPLARQEVCYALTVVLALNGIAAIDDGDKFVQLVPVSQVDQVQAAAPKPDKDSPLISPEAIPQFSPGWGRGPRPLLPDSPQQPSSNSTMDDLLAYYASLTGTKYLPDAQHGKLPALFRINFPITKPELLYAIETTLHFQGFTIAKTENETIVVKPLK